MKVTREVRFSRSEVTELAKSAILAEAAKAIGTPGPKEKYLVDVSDYGTSTVEIVENEGEVVAI